MGEHQEVSQEAVIRRLTISEILEVTYALVSKRIWLTIRILHTPHISMLLGIVLIWVFAIGAPPSRLADFVRDPMMLMDKSVIVTSLILLFCETTILAFLMCIALISMYLQIEDGLHPTYFSCWRDVFVRYVAINWFWMIYSLLIFCGLLLFIVPGIIWALNYSLTPVILIAERDLTVLQAMQRSKHLIYGERMKSWILNVGLGLCFLSILVSLEWFIDVKWAKGIGIVFFSFCLIAFIQALSVVFYLQSRLVKDAQAGLQKN